MFIRCPRVVRIIRSWSGIARLVWIPLLVRIVWVIWPLGFILIGWSVLVLIPVWILVVRLIWILIVGSVLLIRVIGIPGVILIS